MNPPPDQSRAAKRLFEFQTGAGIPIDPAIEALEKATEDFDDQVDIWNKSLDKVGVGLKIASGTAEDVAATAQALRDVGADKLAERFEQRGVAIRGANGGISGGFDANRFLKGISDAALQPTMEGLLDEMQRGVQAQLASQAREFEFQRQLIPTATAERLISQPFPTRALTGITARSGVDPAAASAASKYEGAIVGARDALMEIRDQGLTELRTLGVPQSVINSVTVLGEEITTLQTQAQDLQLGLEQQQYNEQIRVTVRGISDLVALNQKQAVSIGDQVIGASKYGMLQRQQINDSRELTRIQLARSQRELNLQIALSRLRAPGETAEERAVRRREAELLNREQQRELDIGKRTTKRGFAIQDIEFGRQLTDATKQLALLQEGRRVSIEVRGIQQVIAAKEQLLSVRQSVLEVAKQAGIAAKRASFGIIEQLEARLGPFTEAQVKYVNRYVRRMLTAWEPFLDLFEGGETELNAGGGVRPTNEQRSSRRETNRAKGGIDLVTQPTLFMTGEANGREAVVVLKNPSMNGARDLGGTRGGGGINITLYMGNNTISKEADEDRLVRKTVRALHDEVALLVGA